MILALHRALFDPRSGKSTFRVVTKADIIRELPELNKVFMKINGLSYRGLSNTKPVPGVQREQPCGVP